MAGSKMARSKAKITVRNQAGGNTKGGAPPSATGFLNNAIKSEMTNYPTVNQGNDRNFVFTFKSPHGGRRIR